jgi:hypothetical protein
MGFHKIGNPGNVGAMTLHVYIPPYQSCKAWINNDNANGFCRPKMTYFSIQGRRVEH